MIVDTDVYRRLEAEMRKIPAIDTHVHLDVRAPLARDLGDVIAYHNYIQELVTAGAPVAQALDASVSGRDRVMAIVPHLKRSNCSAHAWMLRRVLEAAYDFDEELNERNWEALYARVEEAARRPGRLKELCRLAGVEKILVHLPPSPVKEIGCDPDIFVGLSDLSLPAVPDAGALANFEKCTGRSVHTARQYFDATLSHLERGAAAGQRGLRVNILGNATYRKASDATIQSAFDRAATGKQISEDDRSVLVTFALDAAATGAARTGMTIQVFLSKQSGPDRRIPSADESLVSMLWDLVAEHPRVNFEVYTISAAFTQILTIYSKYLANLYLGGIWWYCQFPRIMSETYSLRFEALPACKWSGFFSDAYVAEWIIGKSAITRKEMARALSEKVLEGYMTEEQAIRSAREVLYETPRRLYRL